MDNSKVWFVIGASKGFGRELVTYLLQNGYRVIATSRDIAKFQSLQNEENFLPLAMEVTNENSIANAVSKGIAHFGRIDVLVNNAGYGLLGTMEEFSDCEIRNVFDVNVFGVINVSKAILPLMRKQKSGVILNLSSISASVSVIATGIYSATKAVVLQLSEALAKETAEFGIKVIAVCPGGFRTDFLDGSSLMLPKNPLPEYNEVRDIVKRFGELNKNQGGDPKKAAKIFVQLAEMPNPPTRFYMGSDAIRMIHNKINEVNNSVASHEELSKETDY